MKLPKSVKVGGQKYKVLFPHEFREISGRTGCCDFLGCQIMISDHSETGSSRANSQVIITFIHELLHAIEKNMGEEIFIKNENFLDGMSHGIYQVLVDNGWLKVDDNAS